MYEPYSISIHTSARVSAQAHIHQHKHTCVKAYTHINTYTHIPVLKHTHTYEPYSIHTYTQAHINQRKHTCIKHRHAHACINTNTRMYEHKHTHASTHTRMYQYLHTRINTSTSKLRKTTCLTPRRLTPFSWRSGCLLILLITGRRGWQLAVFSWRKLTIIIAAAVLLLTATFAFASAVLTSAPSLSPAAG